MNAVRAPQTQAEGDAAASAAHASLACPAASPSPPASGRTRSLPAGLRFTGGEYEEGRVSLPTAWCLKGGAHCSTPPNQKRPRKSNPAETTPPLQPPQWTNRGVGGNPLAASPIEKKIRKILRDQSELQMTIQVGQYGEVRVSVAG